METNIIKAVINLVTNPVTQVTAHYKSRVRANAQGDALEEYLKDLFADTVEETNKEEKIRKHNECFSYLGTQNNPPDFIIRGGDAIEVKKIESNEGAIQLNSSYPSSTLKSTNTRITRQCRECEEWTEKDLIYAVGTVKSGRLSILSMVYGVDYAADEEIYTDLLDNITDAVLRVEDVEFTDTNEIAKVNGVDELGISDLRVRPMWSIKHPLKLFKDIYQRDTSKEFNFMALINQDKYDTLNYTDELEELVGQVEGLSIKDVDIKNPNNTEEVRAAKLITFSK